MNNLKNFLLLAISISIFTGCQNATEVQSSINPKSANTNEQNLAEVKSETPEQKAARLAEEFIKRNGYTSAPADKNKFTYETIEISDNKDEILKLRKNSLQSVAYSVFERPEGNKKSWTVVFRYNKDRLDKIYRKNAVDEYNMLGRAVTMNEKFENLMVEHESILLNKLEKKLQ